MTPSRARPSAWRTAVVAVVGAGVMVWASVAAVAAPPASYTDQAFDATIAPTSLSSLPMLPGDEVVEPFVAQAGGQLTDVHVRLLSGYEAGSDLRVRITTASNLPRPGVVLAAKTITVSSVNPVINLSSSGVTLTEGTTYVLALDSFVGGVDVRTARPDAVGGAGIQYYDAIWDGWTAYSGRGIYASVDVTGTDGDLPTVTASVAPSTPNGSAGWYDTRPTVSFACSDATTRVVDCPSSVLVPEGVTGFSPSVTDLAGNVGVAAPFTLSVDATAPNLTLSLEREPNAHGWYRGAVAYDVQCSDATSGVVSCPASGKAESYGDVTVTVFDVAGHSRERSTLVRIDTRDPRVRIPGLGDRERFNAKPTLRCRARDGSAESASGVRSCRTTIERLSTHKYRATAVARDYAGNRANDRAVFFVG